MTSPDTYITEEEFKKLNTHDSDLPFSPATILASILYSYNTQLVDLLLERGYDLNAPNQENSLLHRLAAHRKPEVLDFIDYLIDRGADIELGDGNGQSPLRLAVMNRNMPYIKYLIEKGAQILSVPSASPDIKRDSIFTHTPFHTLAFSKHENFEQDGKIYQYFLKSPHFVWDNMLQPVNVQDSESRKPIIQVLLTLCARKKEKCLALVMESITKVETIDLIKENLKVEASHINLEFLEQNLNKRRERLEIIKEKAQLELSVLKDFQNKLKVNPKIIKI